MLLRLEDPAGRVGFGEAAPLPDYDGVSVDDVREALEGCRPTLERADPLGRQELLAECDELAVLSPAVAAIDLALWDLEGRRTGQPVWRLLGARAAEAVEVNDTIAASDRAGAAAQAQHGQGGRVSLREGEGRARRRRRPARRGPGACSGPTWRSGSTRTAHGPWRRPPRALRVLAPRRDRTLRGARPRSRPDARARGRDERADRARRDRVGDRSARATASVEAVCLKIAGCGGITGVVEAARRARAAGYEVYLASTLDGPLGIAAALHAAGGRATGPPVRTGDARAVRRPRGPVAGAGGADRGPGRRRPRRWPASPGIRRRDRRSCDRGHG